MSKFIHEYENPELLTQIKYLILSNINEEYPYYYCSISNATYNNYSCCFYKDFTFEGNHFQSNSDYFRIGTSSSSTGINYYRSTSYSSCESKSYSQINQDLAFTNVSNNENGLINLVADTSFNSSGESTAIDFTPYLILIASILMLIFLYNFFKSIFKRRS